MEKVLIDSDVILDFFFDRKPFSDDASQLLILCENGQISGFVTAIMLSNIHYLLRKTAKNEKVVEKLKMLLKIIDVITTDRKAIEDALQNFSAQNTNEIKVIVTRNTKDYKTSKLSIMNPETYLKAIQ